MFPARTRAALGYARIGAMSSYQYYEFLAIDRPLSQEDMAALRRITSRAPTFAISLGFNVRLASLIDRCDAVPIAGSVSSYRVSVEERRHDDRRHDQSGGVTTGDAIERELRRMAKAQERAPLRSKKRKSAST